MKKNEEKYSRRRLGRLPPERGGQCSGWNVKVRFRAHVNPVRWALTEPTPPTWHNRRPRVSGGSDGGTHATGRVSRCVTGWLALGIRSALCLLPNQPFQQGLVTHSHVSHKLPWRVRLRYSWRGIITNPGVSQHPLQQNLSTGAEAITSIERSASQYHAGSLV